MNDSRELYRKLGLPPAVGVPMAEVVPPDSEGEGEGRCFGFLRGVRDRAINLEFMRNKGNEAVSFPYSWLGPSRYHPSLGVLLLFVSGDMFGVHIRGRNLNAMLDEGMSLYERGILRHRVTFIRELTEKECRAAGERECVVERIDIIPLSAEQALKFLGIGGQVDAGKGLLKT